MTSWIAPPRCSSTTSHQHWSRPDHGGKQTPVLSDEPSNPLRKVLVANRGEIAVRVIRAARDAGLRSVAVHAEPDRGALYTRLADEVVALDGANAASTYLNIEVMVAAARAAGADAVHPGYGFLSENADFAQAVLDAGLVWIGPSPRTIRELGDKVTARRIARKVGAPLAAGTEDPVDDVTEIEEFARRYGLPLVIKAAFGGGGRGLKVVREAAAIPELFASATREATAAFGRGECFVERFLDRARHVEAQVLADDHGAVVAVGTRDCSLQRRNQKLIEEAPAPFLSPEQRKVIHESAKEICRAVSYTGAGTVEYLVGEDGVISFLEVNTRLQVEHPVTEETTGVDLVAEQFRIAAGAKLLEDTDPAPIGHSVEFRLTSEDAGSGFIPVPGTISDFRMPSGPGVRLDTGVEAGDAIDGRFDSMFAKLVVTGANRKEALHRARRALAEVRIEGVPTPVPFYRQVVEHSDYVGDGQLPCAQPVDRGRFRRPCRAVVGPRVQAATRRAHRPHRTSGAAAAGPRARRTGRACGPGPGAGGRAAERCRAQGRRCRGHRADAGDDRAGRGRGGTTGRGG
jgi:acetyl-CoA/propionyl-CoA carboxylase biotin carboxyl carrier protein